LVLSGRRERIRRPSFPESAHTCKPSRIREMEQTSRAGLHVHAHSRPVCPSNLPTHGINGYSQSFHHSTDRGVDPYPQWYPSNYTTEGNEEIPRLVETGTRRTLAKPYRGIILCLRLQVFHPTNVRSAEKRSSMKIESGLLVPRNSTTCTCTQVIQNLRDGTGECRSTT
jgi:hypothetical protein